MVTRRPQSGREGALAWPRDLFPGTGGRHADDGAPHPRSGEPVCLPFHLTPAEWRRLLADQSFLSDPDNSCNPRRPMGVPVEIIPDHRFIVAL